MLRDSTLLQTSRKSPREAKVVSDEETRVGTDGTSTHSSLVNGVYEPLATLRSHIGNLDAKMVEDLGLRFHCGGEMRTQNKFYNTHIHRCLRSPTGLPPIASYQRRGERQRQDANTQRLRHPFHLSQLCNFYDLAKMNRKPRATQLACTETAVPAFWPS